MNAITNNKILKANKFFLCIHQASEETTGFESSKNRFTHYSFLEYGGGVLHFIEKESVKTFFFDEEKKLYDLREFKNSNVVGYAKKNSRFISFNPWRKEENWSAELISNTKEVKSSYNYSVLVCLSGSAIVNGKELKQYDYAEINKDVKYDIDLGENCYVGLFGIN